MLGAARAKQTAHFFSPNPWSWSRRPYLDNVNPRPFDSLPLSLSLSIYIYIYIYMYVCIYVYIYIYIYMEVLTRMKGDRRIRVWSLRPSSHRPPDGVRTNGVFTEGPHFPTSCHILFLCHILPQFARFCCMLPHVARHTFSHDNLLWGIAALLRRPRLS